MRRRTSTELSTVCLRLFRVYGRRRRPDMAIHKFTHVLLAKRAVRMFGDGSTSRDCTFIDDIIKGVAESLKMGQ
jgi:UDP-glucuronate 4-epimerase